jgi:predicted SprT family Zn-dependent metalloprotease
VRMLLPPVERRREMDRNLVEFFHAGRRATFRRAISEFCRYYHLRQPRIEWYEYIDWGKTAGRTFEDGRIHLVHPENWKRGRVYKSERMWVQTVYHELAHYLFWTDAERKAETFTRLMVRGLRRSSRNAVPVARKITRRITRKIMGTKRAAIRRTALEARAAHSRAGVREANRRTRAGAKRLLAKDVRPARRLIRAARAARAS